MKIESLFTGQAISQIHLFKLEILIDVNFLEPLRKSWPGIQTSSYII